MDESSLSRQAREWVSKTPYELKQQIFAQKLILDQKNLDIEVIKREMDRIKGFIKELELISNSNTS